MSDEKYVFEEEEEDDDQEEDFEDKDDDDPETPSTSHKRTAKSAGKSAKKRKKAPKAECHLCSNTYSTNEGYRKHLSVHIVAGSFRRYLGMMASHCCSHPIAWSVGQY